MTIHGGSSGSSGQLEPRKWKDPKQVVVTLDHDVQNKSEKKTSPSIARLRNLLGNKACTFILLEEALDIRLWSKRGYVWPGSLGVASDSHSNMYGGIGYLGTPVVRTDATSIWATGGTWWQVPPIVKLQFTGVLPKGVTSKDVIVTLCGLFDKDDV
jgi:homoaconitate hydratase